MPELAVAAIVRKSIDLLLQLRILYIFSSFFSINNQPQTYHTTFEGIYHRDIEAPVPANEAFINLIEVLDEDNHKKGIASCLVQKIIEMEEEKKTYQVRAYCEIHNIASHRLWFKNGFEISPAKESNGQILGSFVTYVCKQ